MDLPKQIITLFLLFYHQLIRSEEADILKVLQMILHFSLFSKCQFWSDIEKQIKYHQPI